MVEPADVAGFEPAVLEDFFGFGGVVVVALEDVGAAEGDDALLVEGEWGAGFGLADATPFRDGLYRVLRW